MLPQCIVFDLDHTLYLKRDYVRWGLRRGKDTLRVRSAGVLHFAKQAEDFFSLPSAGVDRINSAMACETD